MFALEAAATDSTLDIAIMIFNPTNLTRMCILQNSLAILPVTDFDLGTVETMNSSITN